ncbi:MAG: undecaprenyl-diphosphate phosphatase [Oscillospiraceae bacterium]|nr:undecaprenyl-diphosphate phosphatase [Oscillospiraceae bacterium]
MSVLSAIFLGLVQGIAEFLPISSSGHLSIFQNFFGMQTAESGELLFFDVLLHLATLVSVCLAYRKDIKGIIYDCTYFAKSLGHPQPGGKKLLVGARELIMMFFATLPLFIAVIFNDSLDKLYYNTYFIGLALILTSALLYVGEQIQGGKYTARNMPVRSALIVGLCQAVATIPGLSRSGTTIAAGKAAGLDSSYAVKFSFLISIPAILGANILSLFKAIANGVDAKSLPAYFVGMIVAAVVGFFAVNLVRRLNAKGKFIYFAYYCAGVGVLTLLLSPILGR